MCNSSTIHISNTYGEQEFILFQFSNSEPSPFPAAATCIRRLQKEMIGKGVQDPLRETHIDCKYCDLPDDLLEVIASTTKETI